MSEFTELLNRMRSAAAGTGGHLSSGFCRELVATSGSLSANADTDCGRLGRVRYPSLLRASRAVLSAGSVPSACPEGESGSPAVPA